MATNYGYFTQASSGAPTLNGTVGSLITTLDWLLDVSNTNGRKVADKVYTGTNKAVYRFTTGQRFYLRVDDAYAQESRMRGYESMTDVDTGVDPFPLLTTYGDSSYVLRKSFEANSNARDWRATVWARGFNLYVKRGPVSSGHDLYIFGEGIREDGIADSYNTFIGMRRATGTTGNLGVLGASTAARHVSPLTAVSGTSCIAVARYFDGSIKAVLGGYFSPSTEVWGGESFPQANFLYRSRLTLGAGFGTATATGVAQYRGYIPYLWGIASQCAGTTTLDIDDVHTDTSTGASFIQIASSDTIANAGQNMLMETTDTDPLVP